jgi:uncharacterized protein (DUF849 family)
LTKPTILTVAVTGAGSTRAQNPALPITPAEIAQACIDSAKAGAAVAHIHARDPETGAGSMELAYYREVVERVRASAPDLVVNLTAGMGALYVPDPDEPARAAPGTTLTNAAARVAHVVELKPDLASLDLCTMLFMKAVVVNTPDDITAMAAAMRGAGVKPEIEIFDTGDIALAHDLIARGVLETPALFQMVLGGKYGAVATPASMMHLKSLLPPCSEWAGFGIGKQAFPMVAQSYLLGGHVRIGMEDTVHLEKGVLTPDNASLVRKAARIVQDLGGTLATPSEARAILGITRQ